MTEKDPEELSLEEIEDIEKLTLRWIFQAVVDFGIPNGRLQDKYNPTVNNGIWLAGRDAPTRGEDFRVRVSFSKLKEKASWRVQSVIYNEIMKECEGSWQS